MTWSYWREAIHNGEAVFLVGAGISADPPSRLPLAQELSRILSTSHTGHIGLPRRLAQQVERSLSTLRPEVLGDILVEHLGGAGLAPLAHCLHGAAFNRWHQFLAGALHRGCCVVTTNFDNLVEDACDAAGITYASATDSREARRLSISRQPLGGLIVKVHGTLPRKPYIQVTKLALALRQVARGMAPTMQSLLRALMTDRPLIVIGYAGRDDFDIAPWMPTLQRTSPTLWILHDHQRTRLEPLRGQLNRWRPAAPALSCQRAWHGPVSIYRGPTSELRRHLRAPRLRSAHRTRNRPSSPVNPMTPIVTGRMRSQMRASVPKSTQAVAYALSQQRKHTKAIAVIRHTIQNVALSATWKVRLQIDIATMLEKEGADFRSAETQADLAVAAARATGSKFLIAKALDQRGVVERRRGLHKSADSFYREAMRHAVRVRPKWLEMQVRAHRAVALVYLKQYRLALRQHRKVLAFDKRKGDIRSVAMTLNNIGIALEWMGRTKECIDSLRQSIEIKQLLGDRRGIAQSQHNLGHLYHRIKDYPAAAREFESSLRLRRDVDQHGVAQSLIGLGRVSLRLGRRRQALAYAREAVRAMRANGDRRGVRQASDLLKDCRKRL